MSAALIPAAQYEETIKKLHSRLWETKKRN